MNLLLVFKYASRIASVFNTAKKIKAAQVVSDAVPLSVNGIRGEFFFGWRPIRETDSI